jgi:hypothetical protein
MVLVVLVSGRANISSWKKISQKNFFDVRTNSGILRCRQRMFRRKHAWNRPTTTQVNGVPMPPLKFQNNLGPDKLKLNLVSSKSTKLQLLETKRSYLVWTNFWNSVQIRSVNSGLWKTPFKLFQLVAYREVCVKAPTWTRCSSCTKSQMITAGRYA